MNNFLYMVIVFSTGVLLGTLFFGGLWFTIRKIVESKIPAVWLAISFVVRASITLTGLYFIAGTNWRGLFSCLFGFVIARYIVKYLTQLKVWQVNLSSKATNETKS